MVIINKEAIKNVTSAEVQDVYVFSPSLQPGLSGSEASTKPSVGLSSSFVYVIIVLGFTVVLILAVTALWHFIKYRYMNTSCVRVCFLLCFCLFACLSFVFFAIEFSTCL